jgi:branched-chain amino acid transport system substrate-binding protein
MNSVTRHFRLLIIAAQLLTLVGCGPKASESNKPSIKLGAVLPLSGDSAAWGEQGRWGIEYAVNEANEKSGTGGNKIEVVYEDSQAVPRLGVTAATKLIDVDKVPAIIGDIVSSTTLAMAPIVEQKKVVLVGISCSAPAITHAGDFVFRVWPSDTLEGEVAANWARSKGFEKAALLHIATDYGQGLADVFKSHFEAKGGKVVVIQAYSQDQTDFRSNLARIKSDSPDVVYLISYYKDAALVLRQAQEVGLKTQFLAATAVENDDLLKIAGNAADGLTYPTIVDFDADHPTDAQREFINKFTQLHGKKPDWAATHAYDATAVVLQALQAGARTGEEIRALIDKKREFQGITGTIKFDANGDVIDKPAVMKTVRDGKFVRLQP